MNQQERIAYNSTLKFKKEEEFFDRHFYRPIGFRLALFFKWLHFSPNAITVISIFVGLFGAFCFYFDRFDINLLGVCFFIFANMLDCADGQLARLTKQSSRIGRILDGFAGNTWFTLMYILLALRAMFFNDLDAWVFIPLTISGFSHARQAEMADFFKNVHLYFVKKTHGGEVDNLDDVLNEYNQYTWSSNPIKKTLLNFYVNYTREQAELSPEFNQFRRIVAEKFQGEPPADLIDWWCIKNRSLLYLVHSLSFSFRTFFLFSFMLLGCWWWYIAFEIVILNSLLYIMIKKYKAALNEINTKLLTRAGESR